VRKDVETDGGSEARPDDEGCPVRSKDLYESGKLDDLEARLMIRFSPPLRPELVQRCLVETVVRFADARVRAYLPVLIERAATDQLHTEVRHLPAPVRRRSRPATVLIGEVRGDDHLGK